MDCSIVLLKKELRISSLFSSTELIYFSLKQNINAANTSSRKNDKMVCFFFFFSQVRHLTALTKIV